MRYTAPPMTEDTAQHRKQLIQQFFGLVPHNEALGIEFIDAGDNGATMRLPYAEHLIGNPAIGLLHGGAVTTLMDACCGAAVFIALHSPVPIATLDLRIDYLRPGEVGKELEAHAVCYKVTRNVAFARCTTYHLDAPDDPIASAVGTFMIGTKAGGHKGATK